MDLKKLEKVNTIIEQSRFSEFYSDEATIKVKTNKVLSKEERDLIADAMETFFDQVKIALNLGCHDKP